MTKLVKLFLANSSVPIKYKKANNRKVLNVIALGPSRPGKSYLLNKLCALIA